MPKIERNRPDGCRVHGTWLYANQQPVQGALISISPQRAGFYKDHYYDITTSTATTDALGRFSLYLPPSSVLGDYTVVLGEATFRITVPDGKTSIAFAELVGGPS